MKTYNCVAILFTKDTLTAVLYYQATKSKISSLYVVETSNRTIFL